MKSSLNFIAAVKENIELQKLFDRDFCSISARAVVNACNHEFRFYILKEQDVMSIVAHHPYVKAKIHRSVFITRSKVDLLGSGFLDAMAFEIIGGRWKRLRNKPDVSKEYIKLMHISLEHFRRQKRIHPHLNSQC